MPNRKEMQDVWMYCKRLET